MTARPKRAALLIAVVGLGAAATVVYAAANRPPKISQARFAGGDRLTTPLAKPAVAVRVKAGGSAGLRLQLVSASGKPLTDRVAVRTKGRHTLTTSLPLNRRGRDELGRCGPAGKTVLEVRAKSGGKPLRRTTATLTPDATRCAPLRWAPPALQTPEVINVGQGLTRLKLDARDYEIKLPAATKVGGLSIEGGRNVVIRGGHITLPASAASGDERRAIHIQDVQGTVHIEGVLIDDEGGGEGDAISIDAPNAVVQVENVRAVGIRGRKEGVHADVIQPWGGVRELRVDRLTGSSTYQGLQIPIDLGPNGAATIQSTDLTALPGLADGGGHMVWLTSMRACRNYPITLQGVYVQPRRDRQLATSVWPQANGRGTCKASVAPGAASWPQLPISGSVTAGRPPGGDFVPWGVAGSTYRSPGYAG